MSGLSFVDRTSGEDKTEDARAIMREKAPELLGLMAQVCDIHTAVGLVLVVLQLCQSRFQSCTFFASVLLLCWCFDAAERFVVTLLMLTIDRETADQHTILKECGSFYKAFVQRKVYRKQTKKRVYVQIRCAS